MTTRNLLSGPITLSAAQDKAANILHALDYPQLKKDFYKRIEGYRPLLLDLVAHHLGAKLEDILVSDEDYWLHGSFNLCVPVRVETADPETPMFVLIRFPLPYRVGELTNPGNSDEKLNCEAASYAWLQENCPTVPIPKLYGFGLSTNQRWTHIEFLPWWSRWFQQARRCLLTIFGFQLPSHYASHRSNSLHSLDIGYLLIETITDGEMLSVPWDEKRNDEKRQENLQRSLARIMVSLARVPLPRIGSFRLDEGGYLHLINRPLSIATAMHENEGIPHDLPRDKTFSNADDFVLEHVTTFESRLIHQPNAVNGRHDALRQMTSFVAARSILPQLFRRDLCDGPFVFQVTDLHRSNIFVDNNWNITSIIDLEFSGSLPIEFLETPYWLTGKLVDEVDPVEFEPIQDKFLEYVRQEEQLQGCAGRTEPIASIIQQAWTNGAFWATTALSGPITFTNTFYDRILPDCFSFTDDDFREADYSFFARMWRPGAQDIVDKKLQDLEGYTERLKAEFSDS